MQKTMLLLSRSYETSSGDIVLEADRNMETEEFRERLPHTDPESPAVPHWAAFQPPLSNVYS